MQGLVSGVPKRRTSKTSYKVFGGIITSETLGYEVAYNNFAGYPGARAESWSIAVIKSLPLDNDWDIFGKSGLTENFTIIAGSSRHLDLLAGVGIGYNVSKDISVRFEYEDFGRLPNPPGITNVSVSNWGLNLKYTIR
jgi:opacity protein-like surface antigen